MDKAYIERCKERATESGKAVASVFLDHEKMGRHLDVCCPVFEWGIHPLVRPLAVMTWQKSFDHYIHENMRNQ